jgi:tetratricopeptide (TPR) repeat protein
MAFGTRGAAKKAKGDDAGALADFDKAVELDPDYAWAFAQRGHLKRLKGDLQGAIDDLMFAVKLDHDYAWAHAHLAEAFRLEGDHDNAILYADQAIKADPQYAFAHGVRGNAKENKGDTAGALADYAKAIELDPDYAWAYGSRGFLRKAQGDCLGSIADFTKAVELNPKDAWAHGQLGQAKRFIADTDRAIRDLTQALELDPDHANSYFFRALAHCDQQKWADALPDLKKAHDKGNPWAFLWTYLARARQGQAPAAEADLKAQLPSARIGAPPAAGTEEAWIEKVAGLFLGTTVETALVDAADTPARKCQASFYAGFKHLLAGDKAKAKEWFEKAVATRAADQAELASAQAELRALAGPVETPARQP